MNTAADRIGFTIREGKRYVDGGMAWYVCLQGQGETGLYSGSWAAIRLQTTGL